MDRSIFAQSETHPAAGSLLAPWRRGVKTRAIDRPRAGGFQGLDFPGTKAGVGILTKPLSIARGAVRGPEARSGSDRDLRRSHGPLEPSARLDPILDSRGRFLENEISPTDANNER